MDGTANVTNGESNVWCTLVMLGDTYACGAVVMAQSLKGTKYPIWCMVTPDVSDDCKRWLGNYFDRIVEVPFISHKITYMKSKKQKDIYGKWIHHSFTKWNIMNPDLFPINKVILVDADMIFMENCDDLFDLESPAMTFSSPWCKPYAPTGMYNPYGEMKHGQIVPRENIIRGLKNSIVGLACMVLFSPNVQLYNSMMTILNEKPFYGNPSCISGHDEQLISDVLIRNNIPVRHIHQVYNCLVGKKNWLRGETAKTNQWYNGKPWSQSRGEWEDLNVWYDLWDSIVGLDPASEKWLKRDNKGEKNKTVFTTDRC